MLQAGKRNGTAEVRTRGGAWLAALALVLVVISFLTVAQGAIDLRDEGYLWYGAIAVTKGQVPMRDFQSYDPARYYWAAAWLTLLGPGIVPLRIACSAFHFFGMLCGLLVLQRLTRQRSLLIAGGALLTLWLFPPFMLNHTVALVGVWVAVLLIERPSPSRHALAGAFAGLAAVFGRNLGLYAVVSFALIVTIVWWRLDRRQLVRRLAAFVGGVILGYAPMIAMLLVVPGFWAINVDALRWMAEAGSTNIPLPVPWPWRASSPWETSVGFFFVVGPVFYAGAAAWALRANAESLHRGRVLLAATLVGAPYLHYAFSRADLQHLGMGIHPLVLGIMALPLAVARRWRPLAVVFLVAVCAVSIVAVGRVSPLYKRAMASPGWYVATNVGGWTVWMPSYMARFIEGAVRFNATMVRPDEGFLIAPHDGPGLYAILNRDSPVWQLYFLFRHPEPWQRRMIAELERHRVNWVLLEDVLADGREESRFRHTHRLMWEHVVRDFDPLPVDGLPEGYTLLRRRNAASATP